MASPTAAQIARLTNAETDMVADTDVLGHIRKENDRRNTAAAVPAGCCHTQTASSAPAAVTSWLFGEMATLRSSRPSLLRVHTSGWLLRVSTFAS